VNSRISTSVQGGPETSGGNVTLDPAIVILQNSQVRAEAVEGSGGNINIIAGVFLADPSSVVSASSQFGLSGSVNIQSPVSSLSGSLAVLPQRVLESQPLLQQACASQGSGRLSSLVVSGRDTFPVEPGGWMISPLALLDEARQTLKDQQTTAVPDSPLRTHVVENLNTESHISFPRLTNWLRPCS
jgi:large exoprotein involved in heme utilization and adhesion